MHRCYMCETLATTREHVPPLNLFPERKDVEGENYRTNLITIPSCELHNLAKSQDDEFLMVSLAGIIGNNSIGYRHKFGEVDRAIRRSSNRLLDKVFIKKKELHVIELKNNKFIEVIWGTPDIERLNKCFDYIVRGLYFHHFKNAFVGNIKPMLGFIHHDENNPKNFQQFIKDKVDLELLGKERFGNNPEIFYYQITDTDQFGLRLFRLCFYGGINVYASLIPESVKESGDLGMELIKRGVKTVITLGEKTYEFN